MLLGLLHIAQQLPVEPALGMGFLAGSSTSWIKLSNCQMDLGYPEELSVVWICREASVAAHESGAFF